MCVRACVSQHVNSSMLRVNNLFGIIIVDLGDGARWMDVANGMLCVIQKNENVRA